MRSFIIGALLNPSFASTPNSAGPVHSYQHDTMPLACPPPPVSTTWVLTAIDFTLLIKERSGLNER